MLAAGLQMFSQGLHEILHYVNYGDQSSLSLLSATSPIAEVPEAVNQSSSEMSPLIVPALSPQGEHDVMTSEEVEDSCF